MRFKMWSRCMKLGFLFISRLFFFHLYSNLIRNQSSKVICISDRIVQSFIYYKHPTYWHTSLRRLVLNPNSDWFSYSSFFFVPSSVVPPLCSFPHHPFSHLTSMLCVMGKTKAKAVKSSNKSHAKSSQTGGKQRDMHPRKLPSLWPAR